MENTCLTRKQMTPLYVHKRSNHPPRIIDIPQSINKRLSEISYMMKNHSSKTHLSIRKPLMTEDINTDSNFHPNLQRLQHNMQALQRRIAVEKSFGTAPTQLVDEEVSKNSPLHKIFNRNHHKPQRSGS